MDRLVDQNPDHRPSSSGLDIVAHKKDDLWLLRIKGYGAVLIRTQGAKNLTLSSFTDAEIGWRD